jgi:hypothetical protein
MFKAIGFLIMFLSGFWLSKEFDWGLLFWFIAGTMVCFVEEILSHCIFIYRKGKYDRK